MAKVSRRLRTPPKVQKDPGAAVLIFKGLIASLLLSIAFALFLSLVSLITEDTYIDRYMQYIMVAVTMLSIFIGSVYATQKAESRGLIIGMAIGVVYVLVSIGLGMKLSHEPIVTLVIIYKFIAGIAAGALGGLIGVNL